MIRQLGCFRAVASLEPNVRFWRDQACVPIAGHATVTPEVTAIVSEAVGKS
jgi:hypothetical protein